MATIQRFFHNCPATVGIMVVMEQCGMGVATPDTSRSCHILRSVLAHQIVSNGITRFAPLQDHKAGFGIGPTSPVPRQPIEENGNTGWQVEEPGSVQLWREK